MFFRFFPRKSEKDENADSKEWLGLEPISWMPSFKDENIGRMIVRCRSDPTKYHGKAFQWNGARFIVLKDGFTRINKQSVNLHVRKLTSIKAT